MANEALDIPERLSLFSEHWWSKVVTRLNDYEIKVVKLEGEFVWTPTSCSSSLPAS